MSVNKALLIGRLGQNPEVRFTPQGTAVATISVATSESWTDKNTGQKQEATEWHRVTMFNRLAEIAGEYLKKGAQVYIEGKIVTRKWQAKDGTDRYTTEIVCQTMQMLDSRQDGQQQGHQQNYQQPQQRQAHTHQQAPQQQQTTAPADFGAFEDDIPF